MIDGFEQLRTWNSYWSSIRDRDIGRSRWLAYSGECAELAMQANQSQIAEFAPPVALAEVTRVVDWLKSNGAKSPVEAKTLRAEMYQKVGIDWEEDPDSFACSGLSMVVPALLAALDYAINGNQTQLAASISKSHWLMFRATHKDSDAFAKGIELLREIFLRHAAAAGV